MRKSEAFSSYSDIYSVALRLRFHHRPLHVSIHRIRIYNFYRWPTLLLMQSERVYLQHKLFCSAAHFKWRFCLRFQSLRWRSLCGCLGWVGPRDVDVGGGFSLGPLTVDCRAPRNSQLAFLGVSAEPPSLLTSCLEAGCRCRWHCSPTTGELEEFSLRIQWDSSRRKPQPPSGPPLCRNTSGLRFSPAEEIFPPFLAYMCCFIPNTPTEASSFSCWNVS